MFSLWIPFSLKNFLSINIKPETTKNEYIEIKHQSAGPEWPNDSNPVKDSINDQRGVKNIVIKKLRGMKIRSRADVTSKILILRCIYTSLYLL